jgi:2-amino-4-hydroxy-6-hydroxymethyldihydropteridine diphosphokinase/queuosine biosynthesis protein QueD
MLFTVYLGLGSNMGDRQANLRRALEMLSERVSIDAISPVYDTAPVGNTEQPRFLNMVCRGSTTLSPGALLAFVKDIEKRSGRRPGPRNSPRPIDIDILFYSNRVIRTPALVIPHPRLETRAFVLAPLVDIAPGLKHPVSGKTARRLLKGLERTPDDAVRWREAGGAMYEISVEMDFDAAHFLRGYQGKCEALHGHRFKVVATVRADVLNEIGLGYDFTELKRHLGAVLTRFDHTCLNDVTPFKRRNPSSENIAAEIYRSLKAKLRTAPVTITAIEVWESPQSRVTYRPV